MDRRKGVIHTGDLLAGKGPRAVSDYPLAVSDSSIFSSEMPRFFKTQPHPPWNHAVNPRTRRTDISVLICPLCPWVVSSAVSNPTLNSLPVMKWTHALGTGLRRDYTQGEAPHPESARKGVALQNDLHTLQLTTVDSSPAFCFWRK